MANVPGSDALTEARKPLRAYVLRRLVELQAGTGSAKLIPLTEIINPQFPTSDLRGALRGLYRVGLIKAGSSGYRVTQKGQHICKVLYPPRE